MVRTLLSLGLVAVGLYLVIATAVWLLQARLVFFPVRVGSGALRTPADIGLDYQDVYLPVAAGVRTHGWFIPGQSRATLLYLHGNAGNIADRLDLLRLFHDLGLSVLIIDYQGYGRSDGKASEAATYADAEAAWNHLVSGRGLAPHEIIVFGRSLGGAVAAWLATRVHPAGVVLESTFLSIPAMAREHYPWLPGHLSRIRYDTASRIGRISAPLLLMHSPTDTIIPFDHARRLRELAPPGTRWMELRGGHNDSHIVTGASYSAALREFFSAVLPADLY